VVVATSSEPSDDVVAQHAESQGVKVFRGSLDNVADRALRAADAEDLKWFARVCGDRPFTDPGLIEEALSLAVATQADLVTTIQNPAIYPPGLTTEVVRVEALRQLMLGHVDDDDREHVTRAFYRRTNDHNIVRLGSRRGVGMLPLVIDDRADLDLVREMMDLLGAAPERASLCDVARVRSLLDRRGSS